MSIIDLYTEQGSTFSQTITLNEDITGSSVVGTLRDSSGTVVNGIASVSNFNTGSILISLPSSSTALLSVGVALYNIEITDTNGNTTKPVKGRLYVDGEVV
jgi:hypothetical protein